jgi:hypothetical protein
VQIPRRAVCEAPFVVDDTRAPTKLEYREELTELLAHKKRGSAP